MRKPNKLECLPLANFSNLVFYLRITPEPTWVEHLSSSPFWGSFLALPASIRPVWKGLPGTKTLAYFASSSVMKEKVL
jgi:hypothetical protein